MDWLSKSDCLVLISRGLLPVTHLLDRPIPTHCHPPVLLITTWKLVRAHEVTRNEPKIHVNSHYITITECKFIVLRKVTWNFNRLLSIYIHFLTREFVILTFAGELKSEWQQINTLDSRTLLSRLADLTKVASILPLIYNCSILFSKTLERVHTIGITGTFMFLVFFFSYLARSIYFSIFFFLSFAICGSLDRQKPLNIKLFVSYLLKLNMLFWMRLGNPIVFQNLWEFHVSQSFGRSLVWAYTNW